MFDDDNDEMFSDMLYNKQHVVNIFTQALLKQTIILWVDAIITRDSAPFEPTGEGQSPRLPL